MEREQIDLDKPKRQLTQVNLDGRSNSDPGIQNLT